MNAPNDRDGSEDLAIQIIERRREEKNADSDPAERDPEAHSVILSAGCARSNQASYCRLRDNGRVMQAITRDPETMHGIPVFRGTRVPVQTLFDYLEGGETLEDFLEGFPTVTRALAVQALEEAKQLLLARA
jgi:uncharacterized protein (DUF433 family)